MPKKRETLYISILAILIWFSLISSILSYPVSLFIYLIGGDAICVLSVAYSCSSSCSFLILPLALVLSLFYFCFLSKVACVIFICSFYALKGKLRLDYVS